MTYLVTGATGNVGRHVVSELVARGLPVRALTRDPARATFPPGVDVATGTLPDLPDGVTDGVTAVFLVWPFMTAEGAEAVVERLRGRHVVFLSAIGASETFHGRIEDALRSSGTPWTFLRAGGFATNTLGWADGVRSGVVRQPYGGAGRSLIHEHDIADVAVTALTSDGHEGAVYELTGPAVLTQIEQLAVIGQAVGRTVRWEEQPPSEARETMLAQGWPPEFADGGLAHWAKLVDQPEAVTDTVANLTGHPARTFAEWARDRADAFR